MSCNHSCEEEEGGMSGAAALGLLVGWFIFLGIMCVLSNSNSSSNDPYCYIKKEYQTNDSSVKIYKATDIDCDSVK